MNVNGRSTTGMLLLKVVFMMYLVSGILLFLLAALVYKVELGEAVVSIGIVVIYVITSFLGGLVMGKKKREKKYLWGLLAGGMYLIILTVVSAISGGGDGIEMTRLASTSLIVLGASTIGGMIA